ncbi:MAG: hypothetical protein KF906_06730 [Actinobacteria bacterium]|nr:hypothetical protein [Actinomycetota bacterium]
MKQGSARRKVSHRGHRRPIVQAGQEGSSLIIALACLMVMAVILSSLVSYAAANQKSTVAYRTQRDERYAGDAAIKSAINWAQTNALVGRDPELNLNDPACVYDVPTEVGIVTATCAADAGSGSGKPNDAGQVPPEALLLLGTRKTSSNTTGANAGDEPGPYNVPDCAGWWDTVTGWFATGTNPNLTGPGEWSALFQKRRGLGFAAATCDTERTRTNSNFTINGDVVSAGRIQVQSSGMVVQSAGGTIYARSGCNFTPCSTTIPTRSYAASDPLAYLNGTSRDTDPARSNPSAANAIGDIRSQWLPVGFGADGSVTGTFPERTRAYLWAADGSLTPASASGGCTSSTATVIFLPGWYKTADVLNKYTAAPSCSDVTFWFAPDPGADGRLLTDDDQTGAFYFDFSGGGNAQACSGMGASAVRWCIGNSTSQNARVVAGTPDGWSPIGSVVGAPSGSTDTRTRVRVAIGTAQTIDEDLSQSWSSSANAGTIDGNAAVYTANVCIPFTSICFSSDRAIRMRDFTPDVTAPPIDEVAAGSLPAAPNGRLYLRVDYGVTNPNAANAAQVEVNAVSPESGPASCGTYDLFTTRSDADYATGLHTYEFTDAQAQQLADRCGKVDLINGLEVTLKVTGNPFNQPATRIYLDGVSFRYDAIQGANFPNPTGAGSTASEQAAAKSDCDPRKPGAQFVFGGESNAYIGDGSIEICAGPYPDDPENHQSIGVWAVPAVASVKGASVSAVGGTSECFLGLCTWWSTPTGQENALAIDNRSMTFHYGTDISASAINAWADIRMGGYTPPAGYKVTRIDARVSYNPKNQGCTFLWQCTTGAPPQVKPPNCPGTIDLPRNPDLGNLQVANLAALNLYTEGGANCLTPAQLASGATVRYYARANGGLGSSYTDTLDGIELDVTIAPTDTSKAWLRPQSGCITAHPNYNGGTGNPDCAVIRADTSDFSDDWTPFWADKEGQSRGRLSVKGTIYAPTAAIEVDDTDDAYPLATRGAILRHLRVSGWGFRPNYSGEAISNEINKDPDPREATFLACIQSDARRALPAADRSCDAGEGDKILTRSRVRFEGTGADKPKIVWWSDDR